MASDSEMGRDLARVWLPEGFEVRPEGRLCERLGRELGVLLAVRQGALEEFFGLVAEGDFLPAVLDNLRRLQAQAPRDFEEFLPLALALAVVFDQRAPDFWPHHQVPQSAVLRESLSIEERFRFWVESQRSRRLAGDLTKMQAAELKFVVDALVPESELLYARAKVRVPRSQFERAYSMVAYDEGRVKKQSYDWPAEVPYTLANIQKRGGICVDQAYFAMIAGKAHGIPTLFFTGQGADGGHAWFGFLKMDGRWNLDAGRYENQNYATGQAFDPQVWERISDHELKLMASRERGTPVFKASEMACWWARRFAERGRREEALQAAKAAVKLAPKNPSGWELQAHLLEMGGDLAGMRSHFENAIRQFQGEPELRSRFQKRLLTLAREAGDVSEARRLEAQLMAQNSRKRSDIMVLTAALRLFGILEEKGTDAAVREFYALAPQLGRTGGGDFFYEIVRPLVEHLIEEGRRQEAMRVVAAARRNLNTERGSLLDRELEALEKAIR